MKVAETTVAGRATPTARTAGAVLLVDADPNVAELLTTTLVVQGFQVYAAADGPAAVERARAVRAHGVDAPGLFLTTRAVLQDSRNVVKDRPRALRVNLPPGSLGHRAGEQSAVVNNPRPSAHQYSKSSTAQENSGDVSTVRRRGPDPLVPYTVAAHVRHVHVVWPRQ
jgi:hypothetical protein